MVLSWMATRMCKQWGGGTGLTLRLGEPLLSNLLFCTHFAFPFFLHRGAEQRRALGEELSQDRCAGEGRQAPSLEGSSLPVSLLLKIDESQCSVQQRSGRGDVLSWAAEQMLLLSACESPSSIFCSGKSFFFFSSL